MIWLAAIIGAVYVSRMLKSNPVWGGSLRNLLSSPGGGMALGVTAWLIVYFLGWNLWSLVADASEVFHNHLAYIGFMKLLAVILGAAYVYQIIISTANAGTPEAAYRTFLRILAFRYHPRQSPDRKKFDL